MISITDKQNCCGCEACAQKCSKQCITMQPDEEGYLYPDVDISACVNCGLCEKVCPVINQAEPREPLVSYAAINPIEEIRLASSSGGIFTFLAEKVIKEGGVVFGARFADDWSVVHDYTETVEGLAAFRGSKYVQSRIGNAFSKVKDFLLEGRKVLFCGTQCQVAALGKFLGKDYDNLLKVDFICHGVPSPSVWKRYVSEQCHLSGIASLKSIQFRNKRLGWSHYGMAFNGDKEWFQPSSQNPYMRLYLANYLLRPSCYSCPAKAGRSQSDVTLGDFWGVNQVLPGLNDEKGVGLIFINSKKESVTAEKLSLISVPFDSIVKFNPSWGISVVKPKSRASFFDQYRAGCDLNAIANNIFYVPFPTRVIRKVKSLIKKVVK